MSPVARLYRALPNPTVAEPLFFSSGCLVIRLIAPVAAPRPMSKPAAPLSTSTCAMLKTSREIVPMSRMPSTKMLDEASEPRM